MLNLEKIGIKIANQRKALNLTQLELADKLYVTHQAVSKWEKGKSIPSIEILFEMTRLFEVSIDFLLDQSEIKDDDYELQLKQFPREAVISKFINNDNCCNNLENIFYLLNNEERSQIIDQILGNKLQVDLSYVWHIFSLKERRIILNVILSKKFIYDITDLYKRLDRPEQLLVQSHIKNKSYSLTTIKGVM